MRQPLRTDSGGLETDAMDRRPPTIRDVAARAACSIATVSRVVTGHGPVGEPMRKRVVQAALDLGFPLTPAKEHRRPVLGVVVPSLTNPVFAGMLAGIEQAAQANGLSVIMGQTHYDTAREVGVVAALVAERPIGLIMTVCDPSSSEALRQVIRQKLPAATVYNECVPPEFAAVSVDNRAAMRLLTEELIALGHRRILFVGGRFASSDRAACRYAGYREAMEAAGRRVLPAEEVDFLDAAEDIDLTPAFQAHDPSAIVVSNDLLAMTVIASLRRMGLRVPGDVSVTGFDGIDIARHMSPRLTTIVQPSRTMGVLAASMVLGIAAGTRQPSHMRADFTFTRGETIAPERAGRRANRSLEPGQVQP
jgi:DNA-binding LacI/PurR family transcriptional regulator